MLRNWLLGRNSRRYSKRSFGGAIKEFFGWDGYERAVEGWFSFEHILYVTIWILAVIILAVILGKRNRNLDNKAKLKTLKIAAILIDGLELLKLTIFSIRSDASFLEFISSNLPLFLCSIQLFTIPLAAFSKGKVQEAALDFVFIFGSIGAIGGTYLAGNIFGGSPVLSADVFFSVATHSVSGFAALYIGFSGLASMKKENIFITACIMVSFEIIAYVCNILFDCNYMFLDNSAGTPFSIVETITGGNHLFYSVFVALIYLVYMSIYYSIYYFSIAMSKQIKKNKSYNHI